MSLIDRLLSVDGIVSRKTYIRFFVVFTLCFALLVFLEAVLSGIIYLTVADKLLGNKHFLFFPVVLLFLCDLSLLAGSFVIYIAFSVRRARSFSDKPLQYVIYYTVFMLLVLAIAFFGQITDLWKILLVTYFLLFIPYLSFKDKDTKKEER